VVGLVSSIIVSHLNGKIIQMTIASNPTSSAPITNLTSTPTQTSEVNTMHLITPNTTQQFGGKKKNNNNKKNKNSFEQKGQQKQDPDGGEKINER
jgi:hypothetical protein